MWAAVDFSRRPFSFSNGGTVEQAIPEIAKPTWEPLPEKVNVAIFRFPWQMLEMSTTVDWLIKVSHILHNHPRVGTVYTEPLVGTPVDMLRNRAIKKAKEFGAHFVLFVDSDMFPDYELSFQPQDEYRIPFMPQALDFALNHDGPCVVGAPYCSAPPEENVLVMRWVNRETNDPDPQFFLERYSRSDAVGKKGMEEVAALATGVLLIDMRAMAVLQPPWFHYQFTDREQWKDSSTEDVVFTRNLSLLGVPQYVAWSSWAGHWKTKMVGKPLGIPMEAIPQAMKETIWREFNRKRREQFGEK